MAKPITSRRGRTTTASRVSGGPSDGKRISTMVPTPGVERMRMVPPWSSTRDFAIASPSPEPLCDLVSWLLDLLERLAEVLQRLLRDPDACILDRDHRVVAGHAAADRDPGRPRA